MLPKFDKSFLYVLENEGGFANHKSDRGKATKYGITQHTLSAWRGDDCYPSDVKALTLDEAKEIYRAWYWNRLGLDHVQDPICTVLFDAGILFGPGTAAREAQLVLSQLGQDVKVDGVLGIVTQTCLNRLEAARFILAFKERLRKLIEEICLRNPSQKVFKTGWTNRLNRMVLLID